MQLNHSLQLAYCTIVHRGECWEEVFNSLQTYTLAVREKVCPQKPFAIGLRLSERAATELSDRETLQLFRRWLARNNCYVFTLNGFPYGHYHSIRIKEQVYRPDWTAPERVAYTNLLFNLLAELLPPNLEGSVSTLPGSFKEFHPSPEAQKVIRQNLWKCVEHMDRITAKTGRKLYLALEPEPMCLLESSAETMHLFDHMRAEHPRDERLGEHLAVNYDTCHFAVEFEDPRNALGCLVNYGIKIGKIHVTSALKVVPTPEALAALQPFAEDTYLHQVVARDETGNRMIFRDLPDALAYAGRYLTGESLPEWRIHYHVPMHALGTPPFDNTNDHLLGVLDLLAEVPAICTHLEMENYTWAVLPPELQAWSVVDQLAAEYDWVLAQLRERGLA